MLIVIDTATKAVKENFGTNSVFPDGSIPGVVARAGETLIKIHDDSELAQKIMSAYDYELVFDGEEVVEVIVHKTLQQFHDEDIESLKQKKTDELDQECKKAILGYFSAIVGTETYSFSNDLEAQSNFKDGMWALENNRATSVKWTAYDKNGSIVRLVLDLAMLSDVNVSRLTHQQTQVSKFRDVLEPKVKSATNKAELDSIVW